MAERELAILIRARDLASRTVGKVRKEIGSLGTAGKKAMAGLSTAMQRVGIAAATGLAAGVALGARSLGHLERVTNQTNAVLASTKGAAGQSADAIREHAEALEQLTTADDKAIQEGQNMLLTFTKIGGKTFPKATEAVVNMAIAMAKGDVASADFAGTAIQVGKALNDPIKGVTALSKAGVSFTEQQKKQIKTLVLAGKVEEAQAIILRELAVEFGNAGKAAGTGFEADLRRVEDAGEDLTTALARGVMPALARAAKWLSTKLADPAVVNQIEEIGKGLGDAAQAALDFVETIDFKAIGAGLKTAAGAAKTVVSLFMGLPDWVKTAVVTGWGLNKLTGGALSTVVSGLATGLIKGVLGMTAGVVNIKAGLVTGVGGVPGTGGVGGKPGGVSSVPPIIPLLGVAAAIGKDPSTDPDASLAQKIFNVQRAIEFASAKNPNDIAMGTKETNAQLVARLTVLLHDLESGTTHAVDGSTAAIEKARAGMIATFQQTHRDSATKQSNAIERVRAGIQIAHHDSVNKQNAAIERLRGGIGSSLSNHGNRVTAATSRAGMTAKSGGLAAARAIDRKRLSVRTTVNVSTSVSIRDLGKTVVRNNRYGNTHDVL